MLEFLVWTGILIDFRAMNQRNWLFVYHDLGLTICLIVSAEISSTGTVI